MEKGRYLGRQVGNLDIINVQVQMGRNCNHHQQALNGKARLR